MYTPNFEPEPNKDYGHCIGCDKAIVAHADYRQHIDETLAASEDSRSHRIRITNPEREYRVRTIVGDRLDVRPSEVDSEFEYLAKWVERRLLTLAELEDAIYYDGHFPDEWQEWLHGDPDYAKELAAVTLP